MNNYLYLLLISCILLSCKSPQSSVNSMESMQDDSGVLDPLHNSMNSLDWEGKYSGILPCADCMGIQTRIILTSDNSYEKVTIYLGKSPEKHMESGSFTWLKNSSAIALGTDDNSITIYKVEENQLRLLDHEGKQIEGDIANNYLLKKSPSSIVNKYWKAIEIMGQKVIVTEEMKREPFIILRSNGEFSANGGCNSMFGGFELVDKKGIAFSSIAMTEMACMFENYDKNLSEAISMARQFILTDEEHMQLIVGKRAPLAKFVAVYF